MDAEQSTINGGRVASRLLDGDTTTWAETEYATDAWVMVNFNNTYLVDQVAVINRIYPANNVLSRLNGADVYLVRGGVTSTMCGIITVASGWTVYDQVLLYILYYSDL